MTRRAKSLGHVHKDARVTTRPGKKWLILVDPAVEGTKDPDSGERYTYEDYVAQIYDIGAFLHKGHGAKSMTPRMGLMWIVRQYRTPEEDGRDIERFWAQRPELRPLDWDENKDIYLNGHPAQWERLAWDEGLDLD